MRRVKHTHKYPARSESWCCIPGLILFTQRYLDLAVKFSSFLVSSTLNWKMSLCRDVRTCHILSSPSQRAQDHRIGWIGRHLKRSLVQTSAQSRDGNEVGRGSFGLYSSVLKACSNAELYNLPGQPFPRPDCPHTKVFPYSQSELL